MSAVIQLRNDLTYFDIQAPLDGATYTLEMRWNTRALAWFMRLLNEQADTIIVGDTKVVADWPIALYITGRLPPGLLVFWDTSGAGLDPGLNDLGQRVQLLYYTAAELGL